MATWTKGMHEHKVRFHAPCLHTCASSVGEHVCARFSVSKCTPVCLREHLSLWMLKWMLNPEKCACHHVLVHVLLCGLDERP